MNAATQLAPIGQWSRTGLDLPEGMAFGDWLSVGEQLRAMEQSVMWWIGDWLRFGERKYGEKYAEAEAVTGYSYSQLANAKWVAERYDFSDRSESLSWSHHQAAARLPVLDRRDVLAMAAAQGWSRRELKAEIARQAAGSQAPEPETNAAATSHVADRHVRWVHRLVADAFGDWFSIGDEYARVVLGLYQAAGKPQSWRDLARFVSSHQPMTRGALHEAISTLREAFECEAIDRDDEGYWLTEIGLAECRRAFRELGRQLIGMGAEPANDSAPLNAVSGASD
jgi:hypothetical protein